MKMPKEKTQRENAMKHSWEMRVQETIYLTIQQVVFPVPSSRPVLATTRKWQSRAGLMQETREVVVYFWP